MARQAITFLRRRGQRAAPTAEEQERETLQLQLLGAVLQVYSNHPRNYSLLEPRFQVLSLYLGCLSSFLTPDLKVMVIKTLEYVCSGVANAVPTHALFAAAASFMACCETFLAPGWKMTGSSSGSSGSSGSQEGGACWLTRELEGDVELVAGTLEKLIQFDHQFVEVLGTTGVLGEVFYPLLSRALQGNELAVKERQRQLQEQQEQQDGQEEPDQAAPSSSALSPLPPSSGGGDQQQEQPAGAAAAAPPSSATQTPPGVDAVVCLTCRILTTMLQEAPAPSFRHFRAVRLNQAMYAIAGEMGMRATRAALRVLQLAALADNVGLRDDLSCLIELLQCSRHERWRQLLVLKVVKDLLVSNSAANDLWRTFCGFEAAVAALSSLDGVFDKEGATDDSKSSVIEDEDRAGAAAAGPVVPASSASLSLSSSAGLAAMGTSASGHAAGGGANRDAEEAEHLWAVLEAGDEMEISLELMKLVIRTITIAVSGKVLGNLRARVENRQYLKNEIGYDTLRCCLQNSKVLTRERYSREIVECIFMMVTEEQSLRHRHQATVKNADAVLLLFALLGELQRTVAVYILQKLLQLIANSAYVATEQLCLAGALRLVLAQFYDILNDPEDPLYAPLLRLIYLSGRHRVTVPDAISMLRCLARPLFLHDQDGAIVLCPSFRRQVALHPELASRKRAALEAQWQSLLILAELAETSDSAPFLRLGGGRGDLLALARNWADEEPKEIGIMDFDSVYAATAYSEGMRFVMVPTVGGLQPAASSSGFTYSCWFRFGVEETDFAVSSLDEREGGQATAAAPAVPPPSSSADETGVTQRILWLFTVSSTSAKSSLQVYLDLTHRQLCVESYVGKGLDTELIPVDLAPGEWHHFLLVHRRARNLLSNTRSTLSVFLDGVEVAESFKTDHVCFLESQTSRCFVGVPLPDTLKVNESVLRGAVSPLWHLGPVVLAAEALPLPQAAVAIHASGPAYVGSFQGERPAHSSVHAVITALLARLHRSSASSQILAGLAGRGMLQDVLRMDHRSTREEQSLAALLNLRVPLEQVVFSFHAGYASPCEITPRNLSGASAQNLDIYHEPCYRLVNTVSHLSEEARAQWGVVFGDGALMNPLSISDSIFGLGGGPQVLFPLLEVADCSSALGVVLELVRVFCKGHTASLSAMEARGYRVMVFLLARKRHLFTPDVLRACVALAVDMRAPPPGALADAAPSKLLVDTAAMKHVVLNWELWGGGPTQSRAIFVTLLTELNALLAAPNPNAVFNAHRLHNLGLVRWTLSVMMQAAKLSGSGQPGWGLPRISLEDAHWSRTGTGGGSAGGGSAGGGGGDEELLNLCSELLHRLLLVRLVETDVHDMAAVLLSTVAQRPGGGDGSEETDASAGGAPATASSKARSAAALVNFSALSGAKETLSPQSIVRMHLLGVLVKVLAREHDRGRRASVGGAQGVVKKVMEFFTLESDRLGSGGAGGSGAGATVANAASCSASGNLGATGPGGIGGAAVPSQGLLKEDRQEDVLKSLSRCLTPDWFHSMLGACRDAASLALTLRTLFLLLQECEDFVDAFAEYDTGFATLGAAIPRASASPVVLLPLLAAVVGLPMGQVPMPTDMQRSQAADGEGGQDEELHLHEVLEPLAAELPPCGMPRALFGALMGALMEGLNRNLALAQGPPRPAGASGKSAAAGGGDGGGDDVAARARYCVEETLAALKGLLEGSMAYMEAAKSREFVVPLVQSLFTCADVADTLQMTGEQAAHLRRAQYQHQHGSEGGPVLGTLVEEDSLDGGAGEQGEARQLPPPLRATPHTPAMTGPAAASTLFAGTEAQRLLLILTLVLRDSVFTPGPLSGAAAASSAQALVREALRAFPHTAMEVQIYTFQETFLLILADLVKEALSSGDSIPVGNAVAITGVLLDGAQAGLFPATTLTTALDMTLKVAREVSGTRINKSLANDLQQLLLAEAIAIGQAFAIVALRRAAVYAEAEAEAVLALINAHLHLLLAHLRRPLPGGPPAIGGGGGGGSGSGSVSLGGGGGVGSIGGAMAPPGSTRGGPSTGGTWRKALASTLSVNMDDGGVDAGAAMAGGTISSTQGLDLSKSMTSISSMLGRTDAGAMVGARSELCQPFGPDKDEPFVVCLLTELRPFLVRLGEQEAAPGGGGCARAATRICDMLVRQRQGVLAEVLCPEVKDRAKGGGKEKRTVDIYTRGFALLLQDAGAGAAEAEEARFRRFEEWVAAPGAATQEGPGEEDVQQAFRLLQERAAALLPDDRMAPSEVLGRLQASKVPAFSLAQSSAYARMTRGEQLNVRRGFESFINFHQHVLRAGLADIANGSMHWKEVLRSLRGVASVWEGADVYELAGGREQDPWATANPEAKEAATRSLHQNLRWKLDMTEGPERMRRRLKRNFEFEEIFNVVERPAHSHAPPCCPEALPAGVQAAFAGDSVLLPEGGDSSAAASATASPDTSMADGSVERPSFASGKGSDGGEAAHDDFDFRATAKLLKQVALVHKSSGVGASGRNSGDLDDDDDDEEEEDEEDEFGEGILASGAGADGQSPGALQRDPEGSSQQVLNVDMTAEGDEEEGGREHEEREGAAGTVEQGMQALQLGNTDKREEGEGETPQKGKARGRRSSSLASDSAAGEDAGAMEEAAAPDKEGRMLREVSSDDAVGAGDDGVGPQPEDGEENADDDVGGSLGLPPALRTQVSLGAIEYSQANASGSLALLAMQAAAAENKELVCNELIAGFVDESDGAILRIYNAQRCTGLEVRPALFLFCRHAVVMVDGFAKLDSEEAQARGATIKRVPVAAPASATAAGSSSSSSTTVTARATTTASSAAPSAGASATGGEGKEEAGASSASTRDLANRFNVFLRDPSKDDGAAPRPSAYTSSDAVAAANRSDGPSPRPPSAAPGQEGAEAEDERVGFDLENPPHVERMRFDRLKVLYKRRYQFRHVAVEFLDVDGRSFLTAFASQEEQAQVVDLVLDAPIVNSVFHAEGALHKLGMGGGGKVNYKRFMQQWRQQLTSRWQAGRMTNFEYLMHLNALAGRSFHDLTQYPVFPWVLADYTSAELDLDDPCVYRDLRRPMGAQSDARARQFRERYDQLSALVEDLSPVEAEAEAPPFHYGTHYSCAGYVLYYLIRLEPYSRLHLQLQGGKFDKADRLFRDVKSSWDSASRDNLQDVRELIPEFFHLPEFLTNHNQFDYGWLQKGLPVHHVMLPPWAKGDAREFIRLQRMALESKFVSENLCHWIDLIFGCKQTGADAVEAQNVFVHLTYEGVVDIDAIQDPVIREATLAQIHNFGQTPSRLFKRAHPARRVPTPLPSLQELKGGGPGSAACGSSSSGGAGGGGTLTLHGGGGGSGGGGPAGALQRHVDPAALGWHQYTTPPLCIVGAPRHIALRPTATSQLGAPYGGAVPTPLQPVGDAWVVKDRAVGVGMDCALVPPSLAKYARYGSPDYGLTFRVAVPTTRHQYVDRVVSVHEQLHLGPVNCLALDDGGDVCVTGSKDSTVRVWALAKPGGGSAGKSMALQATLCGHSNEVLCVDVAPQLGILLSGGADQLAVAWDLRDFTSQRLLVGHTAPVTSVSINKRTGDMVTLGGVDIRLWNITGDPLAHVSAIAVVKEVPTCVTATGCPEWQDGVVAITGHDNGKICLWGLQSLPPGSASRQQQQQQQKQPQCNATEVEADADAEGDGEAGMGSNTGMMQGRQLKVMQILQGVHTAAITTVRVGREQRDLAVGDATGRLSKWASVRLDQLSERELLEMVKDGRRVT